MKRISTWQRTSLAIAINLVIGLTLAACGWGQTTFETSSSGMEKAVALPPLPPKETVIFPLSEVRRGLRGVAYTVFEGVTPQPMEVEILGLISNALGPGQDMILARLHGARPEYTGVVAGMSGSPVYIDGRLLGALSFRIGQFSKEPIAGITPIQRMLEVKDSESNTQVAGARRAASGAVGEVTPIETPLVFNGFSQEAVDRFGDRFRAMGLIPVAGLGGSNSAAKQPEPLIPGSAVSAVLVQGDLSMAGTCTVTYVDATHLLACGHPITQFGHVSLPMTKATVLATLPSPLNAFKIINTTETAGAFTEDRNSAILGRFGAKARMIPVSVAVEDGNRSRTVHFEVLDNRELTPSTMLVSIYQSLHQTNEAEQDVSYRLSGNVTVEDQPALKLEGILSPNDQNPAAINTALYVGERFLRIYSSSAEQPVVTGLRIEAQAIHERRTADLEEVRLSQSEVKPGETIEVEATLHPFHAVARVVHIAVRVPPGTAQGELRLVVSDGATADRMTLPPGMGLQNHALSLRDTIGQLNQSHVDDRIFVTLLEHSAQAVVEGGTLGDVPLSMANVLEPLKAEQRAQLTGETAVSLGSEATGFEVSGSQVLSLQIR